MVVNLCVHYGRITCVWAQNVLVQMLKRVLVESGESAGGETGAAAGGETGAGGGETGAAAAGGAGEEDKQSHHSDSVMERRRTPRHTGTHTQRCRDTQFCRSLEVTVHQLLRIRSFSSRLASGGRTQKLR